MRPPRILVALIVVLACGGGQEPTSPGGTGGGGGGGGGGTGGGAPGPTAAVSVQNNSFSPSSARVLIGGTVTWTFTTAGHNVSFSDGTAGSGNLTTNETFARNYPTAGTFPYNCTNHAGMNGTVIVQ